MARSISARDLAKIKDLAESRKGDEKLVYTKVMAEMVAKCFHNMPSETAQKVRRDI
jgi:hypothetical protein